MDRRRQRALVIGAAGLVVIAAVVAAALTAGVGSAPTWSGDSGSSTGTAAPEIAPGRDGAVADAVAPAPGGTASAAPSVPPGQLPGDEALGRSVIRTASVRTEVGDPAAAVRDVRVAVVAVGGFVADERSTGRGADLTLRVPVAGLDSLVDRIGGLGTVTERTSTARDVTDQLVDADARVASQRASVERVRALLAQADTIGEIVAVESELTARQADLDSLERRLALLRSSTELATLQVSLVPLAAAPAAEPGTGFGAGLGAGWAQLKALGAGLATVAGFVLPFLPVVAVLVLVARPLVRRLRARRKPAATVPDAG